ncbi:hypothetical protein KEM55_007075 [Ascosphaera atra]|nr:hypothetical protein KEM55_007075 [Ascosphaera atra]
MASPFFFLYGIHPRLLGEEATPGEVGSAEERHQQVAHARLSANEALLNRAVRTKRILDSHVTKTSFQPDDWVLVRNELRYKLEPQWFGPYKVVKSHPLGTYQLVSPDGQDLPHLVNDARLMKANVVDPQGLWASGNFTRALKRAGVTLSTEPHELRHVLEAEEQGMATYAELSDTSQREWITRFGDAQHPALRRKPSDSRRRPSTATRQPSRLRTVKSTDAGDEAMPPPDTTPG